jgi:hypothetical protein
MIYVSCRKWLHLLRYLASFFSRLRLTVDGYGAKNTASLHIKSFQGFEGTGKEEE